MAGRDTRNRNQADADVGYAIDDIFGSDTLRKGIYYYYNAPDQIYGNQVHSFMIDLLTAPYAYIPGSNFF